MSTMKTSVVNTLSEWERQNGQCWVQKIHSLAESGETWQTTAEYFGVNVEQLKNCCRGRGFKFPWQGAKSPLLRQRQREACKNNGRPRLYWYRGKQYMLVELAELSSIKETTIYRRINSKQWTVEKAVETPVYSLSACGHLGGKERVRRHAKAKERAQTNRVADATHGLQAP